MLTESFIFLDRVSTKTEQKLWSQGINTWDDFLAIEQITGVSPLRKLHYDRQIRRAQTLLQQRDLAALACLFPQNQHWRLYNTFQRDACALDIETSGYYGDITVVGLHDRNDPYFFVQGKNLSAQPLKEFFREPRVMLTFNGSSFDIPVLIRYYPHLRSYFSTQLHIDLRHVAAKLGYSGGLKTIERILDIARDEEIAGMSGDVAVQLWYLFCEGDEEALRTLLAYNEADIVNLFTLADMLIPKLWRQTRECTK